MTDEPRFIHDTKKIISVNGAACDIFRADEVALVDSDMMDWLPDDTDRRWLVQMRMNQMRKGREMPPFVHLFRRLDGSLFWGAAVTDPIGDGRFETRLIYLADEHA